MELVAIRRVILGVLFLGMTGVLAELLLQAHYEDFAQWIPLVIVGAGLAAMVLQLVHPRQWTVTLVGLLMSLLVLTGFAGVYLHYKGSSEFQLEMDPGIGGARLLWQVLRSKSPPTLAPGTLVSMGILGLGYAYLVKKS
jgi:hypothetical protein